VSRLCNNSNSYLTFFRRDNSNFDSIQFQTELEENLNEFMIKCTDFDVDSFDDHFNSYVSVMEITIKKHVL